MTHRKNPNPVRSYTMTPAARLQRKRAASKPNAIRDWRTTKLSGAVIDRCHREFGSVNIALGVLFEMLDAKRKEA